MRGPARAWTVLIVLYDGAPANLCECGPRYEFELEVLAADARCAHVAVCCLLSDVVRYCTGYEVAVAVANAGYAVVMYATTLYDYLLYV